MLVGESEDNRGLGGENALPDQHVEGKRRNLYKWFMHLVCQFPRRADICVMTRIFRLALANRQPKSEHGTLLREVCSTEFAAMIINDAFGN